MGGGKRVERGMTPAVCFEKEKTVDDEAFLPDSAHERIVQLSASSMKSIKRGVASPTLRLSERTGGIQGVM